MSCTDARRRVSERLDGEATPDLDGHLAGCAACRRFLADGETLRRALRMEAVGPVPDIAGAVRRRLDDATPAPATARGPSGRRPRSTLALAAAALLVGALIGVNLVGVGDDGPPPVAAAGLPARVAAAQLTVDGLHAELSLVERGWHPAVPERRYTGTLDYRAPESLALVWQDATSYPSGTWRPNDVSLHTNGGTWVASGVRDCPARPECTGAPEERTVTGRPPFADDAPVPLELVAPVRSFAVLDTAEVVGAGEVAGRPTVEVTARAAQVAPLLEGLRPAGNLRRFHPTDEVAIALDAERMVPLRIEVRAADDAGRAAWAAQQGYADRPGLVLLQVAVSEIDFAVPPADRFAPPAGVRGGDAGFRDGPTGTDLRPAAPAGFGPGRSGRIDGPTPTAVWSWTDGAAWVRLQVTGSWDGPGLFGDLEAPVRPIEVAGGGGYVGAEGRRLAVHGDEVDVVVDGSVPLQALVAVVDGLDLSPAPLPEDWPEAQALTPATVARRVPTALRLDVDGFADVVGRVEGDRVLLAAFGAGDRRLLLEQARGSTVGLPTEVDYEAVRVRGVDARYTPARTLLEWVEDGWVVTLRGTGVTRDELLAVAAGLGR